MKSTHRRISFPDIQFNEFQRNGDGDGDGNSPEQTKPPPKNHGSQPSSLRRETKLNWIGIGIGRD